MSRTPFCWVRRDFMPVPLPGLVLEWRRDEEGWLALVAVVEQTPPRVVIEWFRAQNLRPVPASPSIGSRYG